jgi:hypothetical protein
MWSSVLFARGSCSEVFALLSNNGNADLFTERSGSFTECTAKSGGTPLPATGKLVTGIVYYVGSFEPRRRFLLLHDRRCRCG